MNNETTETPAIEGEDLGTRYIFMFYMCAEFEWFLGLENLN